MTQCNAKTKRGQVQMPGLPRVFESKHKIKQGAKIGRQHIVGFGSDGLNQKIGKECKSQRAKKTGGEIAANALGNAKNGYQRNPIRKLVNEFKSVFKATRYQKRINLNGTNTFGVGVHVPVCAAKVRHCTALNVLHHAVEVPRHTVPNVGNGKQYQHQVGNGNDQQSQCHYQKTVAQKSGQTAVPTQHNPKPLLKNNKG